jgi:hypothetical protein
MLLVMTPPNKSPAPTAVPSRRSFGAKGDGAGRFPTSRDSRREPAVAQLFSLAAAHHIEQNTTMKTMIKQTTILWIICGLAAVAGCASPQEKAVQARRQQRVARMQQEEQLESSQRSENVKQNWPKLHEGLSLDEVDQLVGPLNKQAKKMYMDSLSIGAMFSTQGVKSSNNATFQTEAYIVIFDNGQLKSWKLRQ